MSLLLEALKRAEAAKQQGAQDGAAAPSGLTLDLQGSAAAEPVPPPLMTRDRLPDITQPLEILSDDLPSAGPQRADPAPVSRPGPLPRGAS